MHSVSECAVLRAAPALCPPERSTDAEISASVSTRPTTAKIDAKAAAALPKKQRPQSRGAVWLSSYHKESFHRMEYRKPGKGPKPAPAHRPM